KSRMWEIHKYGSVRGVETPHEAENVYQISQGKVSDCVDSTTRIEEGDFARRVMGGVSNPGIRTVRVFAGK
ncbi:MAG TPA: hypothetical protein P5026_08765, partial [Kiritimatiellia bacterium]|nr:hypothetical protein [Kiritimatiellia bacterium]